MLFAYLSLSLLVFILSFALFQRAAGSMSFARLNLVSWAFYFYLVLQSFVGINLALVFDVPHYLMDKADPRSLERAYWAVCYVMLAMPLTMIAVQELLLDGNIRKKAARYFDAPLTPMQSRKDSSLILFWVILTAVSAVATVYTYSVARELPFLALIRSGISGEEFAQLRIAVKLGFTGNIYVRNLFSLFLAPLASFVAYGYCKLYRNDMRLRLWFYVSAVFAVMALTFTGAKGPIINYLLTFFFIRGFIRGRTSGAQIIVAVTIVGGSVLLLYALVMNDVTIALNRGPIGRILMTSVAGLPLHFEAFPGRTDFLQGGSFPAWMAKAVFQVEHARSARVVMEIFNPAGVAAGTAGVMNTLFIGEAWANFGWLGFWCGPIVVGAVVQVIHIGLWLHQKRLCMLL